MDRLLDLLRHLRDWTLGKTEGEQKREIGEIEKKNAMKDRGLDGLTR